jgi:hypothetical protein
MCGIKAALALPTGQPSKNSKVFDCAKMNGPNDLGKAGGGLVITRPAKKELKLKTS